MKKHWALMLCLSWLLAFALGNGVLAQNKQELTQPKVPLERLLNRGGTLDSNKGSQGNLNPAGWQMTTGPNEEPRFAFVSAAQQTAGGTQLMAVPGDENWDDRFGAPGLNGIVYAVAVSGENVYVGGSFTSAGGVPVDHIAKWNGTNWSALGNGMDNLVYAIAVNGNEVYAASHNFVWSGGGPWVENYVSKWDGTNWSVLGGEMSSRISALAVIGSEVYAGGKFTTVGGVYVGHIVKWNGTNWTVPGGGLNGEVDAIAVSGDDLYVGGYFRKTGDVPLNFIAKWSGESWSALGSGMNGNVRAIAVSSDTIYAGGEFTTAGGVPVNYIAKWDGATWSELGSGMNNPHGSDQDIVFALAARGSEVYAGGVFTAAGGVPANHIAKWDGTSWSALGSGMSFNEYATTVFALAAGRREVYAGGNFTTAGGKSSLYFGRYALNTSPTSDAGTAQTVIVNETVQLDGSGSSDPDCDPITYSWEITSKPDGSSATLSNLSIVNPTFVADKAGEYKILLVVNDGTVNSAPDEVIITVITAQQASQNLIDQIQDLIDAGVLNGGQGNALISKLEAIIKQLDKGNATPAINQLQAFINEVNAFMSSTPPILTPAEGQPLIDAANAIIAALNAGGAFPKLAAFNQTNSTPPSEIILEQNSPNPFNPVTTIQFSVPRASHVRLKVYNSFGAEVATLVDQQIAPGTYRVNWDASRLASGFYLYRLEAEGFAQTKKLLLMK